MKAPCLPFATPIRLAAIGIFLSAAAAPAQTDVAVNGSFETGPGVSNVVVIPQGSNSIFGWTVVDGDIDYVGSYWMPANASVSLDLNASDSAGGVAQLVPTNVGDWYEVVFAMSGNPVGGDVAKTMDVRAGSVGQSFSYDTTGNTLADMNWVDKSLWFQASTTLSEIRFVSGDMPSAHGPALDNVRVFEYDFRLQVEEHPSGSPVSVCALGATPNATVLIAYSFVGAGPIGTPFGNLMVSNPYSSLALPQTDASGNTCLDVNVPPSAFGRDVWVHAFDDSTKTFSNGVAIVLGP